MGENLATQVEKMSEYEKIQYLLKVFIKNVDFFDNIGYNIDIECFRAL